VVRTAPPAAAEVSPRIVCRLVGMGRGRVGATTRGIYRSIPDTLCIVGPDRSKGVLETPSSADVTQRPIVGNPESSREEGLWLRPRIHVIDLHGNV